MTGDEVEHPAAPEVLVEICVDDLAGALTAQAAGADRIELCADLAEGGTTPSAGLLEQVLTRMRTTDVQVMVRPRGGDFVYSDGEFAVLLAELARIRELATGAPVRVGVVLGVLRPTGELDLDRLRTLVAAAAPLKVTVHKAFDAVPDPLAAFDDLAALGVERVLTSGGAATAADGAAVLACLVQRAAELGGAPAVLAGGSVRPANARELLERTGVRELHLRAQTPSARGDGTLDTDAGIVVAIRRVADGVAPDPATSATGPTTATASPHGRASAAPRSPLPDAVLALDIGGTTMKGAVFDLDGRPLLERSAPPSAPGEPALRSALELFEALRADAVRAGRSNLVAGVTAPGTVDPTTGVVGFASVLDWRDVPLRSRLEAASGIPVVLEHDVRAAGAAEHALIGDGDGDAVFIAIGTGVAASLVADRAALAGATSAAGELGHVPVLPDGERCPCGQRGCLQVYCSGGGIARRYRAAGGADLDAAQIVARLGADALADRVWADAIRALALGLASVTMLLDPATIVLGGGVARAGRALLEPASAQLSALLTWRRPPEVRLSVLGASAGLLGAGLVALRAAGVTDAVDRWRAARAASAPAPADPSGLLDTAGRL